MHRLLALVLVAAALAPAAQAPAAAEACEPGPAPYSSVPGAALTPTVRTSKDQPPVRYVMWRGTVPSFDGLPMSVDVTLPCDITGPVPLVTMNHGWSDDKTIWEETGRSDTVSSEFRRATNHHWNNIWFASRGYAVLNFTARGWHDSCGPRTPGAVGQLVPAPQCQPHAYWIHMGDMRWEARDIQWLTAGLVSSGVADPRRLAISGGSYGGGPTIMNALLGNRTMCGGAPAFDGIDPCAGRGNGELVEWRTADGSIALRWAVAVPMYTWGDVIQVLLPNGRGSDGEDVPDGHHTRPIGVPIDSYFAGLYATGQPAGNGFYAPPGADPTSEITLTTLRALAGDPLVDDPQTRAWIEQYHRFKSAISIEPATDVPIFWVQGFTDPLFTGLEALQVANKLRAHDPDYPIKLFFGDLGHDYASERVDEWDLAHEQMNAFLDHYLREGSAQPAFDVGAMVTRCFNPDDPMEYVSAPDWPSIHPGRKVYASDTAGWTSTAAFSRTGLETDPVTHSSAPGPQSYKGCRRISPARTDPGTASWTFTTTEPVVLLGSPVVDLTYSTSAPDTQLNVRLWEVAPDGSVQGLVTRGTFRAVDGPGAGLRARFQMAPNGYRFRAGHGIKLEVTGNDAPYRQRPNVQAVTAVSHVELTLPTR